MGTLIEEFFKQIAQMFIDGYLWVIAQVVTVLSASNLPAVAAVKTGAYQNLLGGTFGLAVRLFQAGVVIVILVMTLTMMRQQGRRASRVVTSLIGLLVLVPLFYTAYSAVTAISLSMSKAAMTFSTNGPQGSLADTIKLINGVTAASNPLGMFVVGLFGALVYVGVMGVGIALSILTIVILLFYPIVIALRPFGDWANEAFHTANSLLITTILAPPVMASLIGLVVSLSIQYIPFGGTFAGMVITTMAAGVVATMTPFVMYKWFHRASFNVFGRTESSITGRVDIASLPPIGGSVTAELESPRTSAIGTFARTFAVDAIADEAVFRDGLREGIERHAQTAATAAATAAYGPAAGALVNSAGNVVVKKRAEKRAQTENSQEGE